MTKIAHLTSVHVPLDIRIFHKECKTLARAGYEVVLIVPRDQTCTCEIIDGVRVLSVPKPTNRRERMTRTLWSVYRAALREHADAYHFHDPEMMIVGFLLKLQGKRVVYDVHEDIPRQIMTRHWIPRRLRGIVSRGVETMELAGTRLWDGIVAVTPTIARRFPADKTILVQNFPIRDELIPVAPLPYHTRPALVAYVGKIEGVRGAREMVRTMAALPSSIDIRFAMAGEFAHNGLKNELRQEPGWNRTHPLGWLTRPEIATLLARARIGLVVLHPVENYIDAQPIKLFEYMAAGMPVIASDFPRWRALIGDIRCCLFVDPLDPCAIAQAIRWLLEHPDEAAAMGQRGQAAVRDVFNWEAEGARLVGFYDDMLNAQRSQHDAKPG